MSEHVPAPAMSFAEYCALDCLNWSLAKWADVSMLHFRNAEERKLGFDSDPFRLGRAFHSLTLEPDTFGSLYAIWEGKVKRGKEWDAFAYDHQHQTILRPLQVERARAMAAAVRAHPVAASYLSRGVAEETLVWTDEATGLRCKARLDFRSHYHAIVDLKSMTNMDERAVAGTIAKYGYHGQKSWYREAVMASGIWTTPPKCIIIGVEPKPPHDVGVFELDEETLRVGAEKGAELRAKIKAARDAGQYPGRYPTQTIIQVPDWALGDINMEEEGESDE